MREQLKQDSVNRARLVAKCLMGLRSTSWSRRDDTTFGKPRKAITGYNCTAARACSATTWGA
jgi:hypothetical protein